MIDAVRVDRCSELAVLRRAVLPLAGPAVATVAVLKYVSTWNDYGGPRLYLHVPERFPLAYGLEQFVSAHSSEMRLPLAAAVLFTLPIERLFLTAQRTFVCGITTTGLRG